MMTGDQAARTVVPAATAWLPPCRMLLLGCSKAKTSDTGLIPAIQRYDGPAFRVLRRYLRERPDSALQVYVLSAEFGLIAGDHPIPHYDRQMTEARAKELRPLVRAALVPLGIGVEPGARDPRTLLIVASKAYLPAIGEAASDGGVPDRFVARGSQGGKLAALRDWLYGAPPEISLLRQHADRPTRFRGVDVILNRDDVLKLGTGKLPARATKLTSWAVGIEGHRVAPKWLVSHATGLPVSQFTTRDALLLLTRLGIEIERL